MTKKLLMALIVALSPLLAQANTQASPLYFMTSPDQVGDSASKITLTNTLGSTENVTGLYLQNLWYATSGTCGVAFDSATTSTVYSLGYGMMFKSISFANNQVAVVGANFLYNMIVQYMAIANLQDGITPNSTPGATPGTWCIRLGITSTFTTLPPLPCNPAGAYSCLPALLTSAASQIAVTCTDSSPTGASGACVTTSGATINQNFPG